MAQENNIGRLLPISENNGIQAVSGRYLHSFLQSKQEFSTWIKSRIKQYGFVENQDFEVFDKVVKNPKGGRPLAEYVLSIDMAKELSMVERTERGRQARRYFIECEQALKKSATHPQVAKYEKMMKEAFKQMEESNKVIKKLENQIWEERAKTVIENEKKIIEMNLKNSMASFLFRNNLYSKWQSFEMETKIKETTNRLIRENQKKVQKQKEEVRPYELPW